MNFLLGATAFIIDTDPHFIGPQNNVISIVLNCKHDLEIIVWHCFWGDINKCLFIVDKKPMTDQSTILGLLVGILVRGYLLEQNDSMTDNYNTKAHPRMVSKDGYQIWNLKAAEQAGEYAIKLVQFVW